MGSCPPRASCQPAHCTAGSQTGCSVYVDFPETQSHGHTSPITTTGFNSLAGPSASEAFSCHPWLLHATVGELHGGLRLSNNPLTGCSFAGNLPALAASDLLLEVSQNEDCPSSKQKGAGRLHANRLCISQSKCVHAPPHLPGPWRGSLRSIVPRDESRVWPGHCLPPSLISRDTWQNCNGLTQHQAGIPACRGMAGQRHTMDFLVLSLPFYRKMMFISKFLTLICSDTWAETQQNSGVLRLLA